MFTVYNLGGCFYGTKFFTLQWSQSVFSHERFTMSLTDCEGGRGGGGAQSAMCGLGCVYFTSSNAQILARTFVAVCKTPASTLLLSKRIQKKRKKRKKKERKEEKKY